ncbi:MAG: XRE family transcriptional regulator [Gammaproteobacteria bacterium]|nr:MAG: XRE family transcriptional regulator [Gammaproteobacteria bacterium]
MIKTVHDKKYQALLVYLRTARESQGLTLAKTAELIGETFQIVSKIETGERKLSVHEYVQYCAALKIDPEVGLKILK